MKSFDELQQDADAHWRTVSAQRTERQTALDAAFASMPDVVHAPPIGTLFSHPALVCTCGGLAFTVRQYGCLNGHRDKAVFTCQRCSTTRTWSWSDMRWLD